VVTYHNENDEFQMDRRTVACIGRNTGGAVNDPR